MNIRYLEFAITHDSACEFGIHIFLVRHTSSEPFLPQHITQRSGIVVGVVPHQITRLRIASLDLRNPVGRCKINESIEIETNNEYEPSASSSYFPVITVRRPFPPQHHTVVP